MIFSAYFVSVRRIEKRKEVPSGEMYPRIQVTYFKLSKSYKDVSVLLKFTPSSLSQCGTVLCPICLISTFGLVNLNFR